MSKAVKHKYPSARVIVSEFKSGACMVEISEKYMLHVETVEAIIRDWMRKWGKRKARGRK